MATDGYSLPFRPCEPHPEVPKVAGATGQGPEELGQAGRGQAPNTSQTDQGAAGEPPAFGHLGVVVFSAKWPPLVEVPSLPPWARLPARPVYRRSSRPPGCREFRPQACYKQHSAGCPSLGALATRGHRGADLPASSLASRSGCPRPLCHGLVPGPQQGPQAGLHAAATLSGIGCRTAAPAVTHALVRRPRLGGTRGRGGRVSPRPALS